MRHAVAATAIEPLLSHLPADTSWFDRGDVQALRRVLSGEHERFVSHLALLQRHDSRVTTKLVEAALTELTHRPGLRA